MQKIIIFTGSGAPAVHAANIYHERLGKRYSLVFVEEKGFSVKKTARFLLAEIKGRGFLRFWGAALLCLYKACTHNQPHPRKRYPIHLKTSSINDDSRIGLLLEQESPQYIIINACHAIQRHVLRLFPCVTINLHNGIVPRYRGSGNIAAFSEANFEVTGFTIHEVSAEADDDKRLVCRSIDFLQGKMEFCDIDSFVFKSGAQALVDYILAGTGHIESEYENIRNKHYVEPTLTEYYRAEQNYMNSDSADAKSIENEWKSTFYDRAKDTTTSILNKLLWLDENFVFRKDSMLAEEIKNTIKPGSLVLDIGCGDCRYKNFLDNCMYIGVDYTIPFLQYAKEGNRIAAESSRLPFKDKTFDAILCVGLLQLLPSHIATADEIVRVLKPGGVFICNTLRQFSSLELALAKIAFRGRKEERELIKIIAARDYFRKKKADGVMVARRFSRDELGDSFGPELRPDRVIFDGFLKTSLFSREITCIFKAAE